MGKASVAQVQQDVPGNASREVFQGLFKDLGKQAMALEAILRAVCGRVDKMENWLTEVSFGMTELDLKLRNIAHNIDGTAAVDDEAQGPHRWTIPPPDDNKPLAPTVSKKLGMDKKVVRVTGMAAAILDRLATTSNASTPTAAEKDKADKTSSKKKGKEKKHSTKKVKSNVPTEVAAAPLPTVAENAPPAESKIPEPQHVPVPIIESAPKIVTPPVQHEAAVNKDRDETRVTPQPQAAEAQLESIVAHEAGNTDEVPATIGEQPTASEKTNDVEVPVEVEPPATIGEPVSSLNPQVEEGSGGKSPESDLCNEHYGTSSSEISPVLSARDPVKITTSAEVVPAPVEAKPDVQDEKVEMVPSIDEKSESPISQQEEIQERNRETDSEPVKMSDEPLAAQSSTPIALMQAAAVGIATTLSTTKSESVATPPQKVSNIAPKPTPSVSSILPTVQFERSVKESFALNIPQPRPAINPAVTNVSAVPISSELETHVAPLKAVSAQDTAKVVVDAGSTSVPATLDVILPSVAEFNPPVVAEPVKTAAKAIKAVGMPIRATASPHQDKPSSHASEPMEQAVDPLLPHRATAHRRSSKMIQRPSLSRNHDAGEGDATRRLSENKRGSQSRRTSISPPVNVLEEVPHSTHQPASQPLQAVHLGPVPASVSQVSLTSTGTTTTSTTGQDDINEENEESDSDASSDGSGSSSGEEEEDDEEAGAAVEEISKTMTALKKLKRANMLSPEEETELKERAHKKWFQLKGHIKEKQKKDVTNILLKRKKNVFTVSSRIELLEEKSREIFAALKHMTNEMREKNDKSTHETLRRRVADMEQSLQSVDSRIASLAAPAMEKVSDLASEVISLRTIVQLQLTTAQSEATARHLLLEEALASQRALVESLAQDLPAQLSAQADLFIEKLKQQPDYTTAIENLRRSLRRKADLKLLKELEARLLGLDAENEDCLVRCLSCRKEVINPNKDKDSEGDEQELNNTGGGQLRKINPGPSSARIYRSNVPFSAQPLVQESILEESSGESFFSQTSIQEQSNLEPQPHHQLQSAGDSRATEKPPVVRVPSAKWTTPNAETSSKRENKTPQPSPLSLMNITATRAILSPDRPISAPVVPMKRKPPAAARSKSLLKSLNPQSEPQ